MASLIGKFTCYLIRKVSLWNAKKGSSPLTILEPLRIRMNKTRPRGCIVLRSRQQFSKNKVELGKMIILTYDYTERINMVLSRDHDD